MPSTLVSSGKLLSCYPFAGVLVFMPDCAAVGIRQAFTSYNKSQKGNADTERVLWTSRRSWSDSTKWTSLAVFFAALERWISAYNAGYLHTALGYRSPEAEHFSHAYLTSRLLNAAAVQ